MTIPLAAPALEPLQNFKALDGCHCVSSCLARIFDFYGHPLSEEMLFGLGAGMGFVYWRMKLDGKESVFIGGRGNVKSFYQDLASRTGVSIRETHTTSPRKAEAELLRCLSDGQPVMLGGDMAYLPWFDLPPNYHFGGHTFVACGYDGQQTVLASDIDQKASGRKRGFYSPITLEQLRKARSSPFKPFPPENLRLEFDFSAARTPTPDDVLSAIQQTVDALLNPPIKNLGIRGIRHTSKQLLKWLEDFDETDLRMNLFGLYVSIEIGGTGGGCFRPMFARFLEEGAAITGDSSLLKSAGAFTKIGSEFSRIGLLFREAATMPNLSASVQAASGMFAAIADMEEEACHFIEEHIGSLATTR